MSELNLIIGQVCQHGQLARSCDICGYQAEIARLQRDLEEAQYLKRERMDRITELERELAHWRSRTVSDPATIALMEADGELARERAAHAETKRELRLRHARIEADSISNCAGWAHSEKMMRERDAATALLREVAGSGVEFDDERVSYVAVQIDRETWQRLRAFLVGETT